MAARIRHWLFTIPRESALVRYGVALAATVLAYALQAAIWRFIPPSPHLFFYPAVFLGARLAGARGGYATTAFSVVAIAYGFLPPDASVAVSAPEDVLDLAIFAGVGIGISAGIGRLKVAIADERAHAREAERAKKATEDTWSMIAHDLRGPLNTISIGSEQLGRRLEAQDTKNLEHTVAIIKRSTSRARDLVTDAVEAMRLEGGALRVHPEPCKLVDELRGLVDSLSFVAEKKGVHLALDTKVSSLVVCDAKRILQVVANLVGNAIKFTPAGGAVTVAVEDTEGHVYVRVSDTGKGIPEAELGKIFDRYWTRDRAGGVGLGLWIARTIVEAHASRLEVSSRSGEGATFSFALPHGSA